MPEGDRQRDWAALGRIILTTVGVLCLLAVVALTIAPIFMHTDTYGQHDWDPMQAHRYLAVKTIKRYHQFPFWNPYNCGGHTWWGGLESGSNLVSPWFPLYMLLPLTWALRLEIVGTTLLSALGCWFFAGRFTKSAGLRLLAVAAFAINGRFGEQISVGHAWHLYYAWTPWALFFLDRAIAMAPEPWTHARPLRDITLLGATLAMMVYTGGIYPLPQTIFVIACYAIVCAIASRSFRPMLVAIAGGALSFAFSAPRLLPLMDMLRRFPRLVDSPESMDLAGLVGVYTAKEGGPHPAVGPWGWHEFGIYIGWIPFGMMIFALLFARRARERGLRLAGGLCILLGLGRFNDYAPWGFLHDHAPIFESQHVPSRWLYPAGLVLVVATSAIVERALALQSRRGWLDAALLALAAYVAVDVAIEAQKPLGGAFVRKLLATESMGPFHMEKTAPANTRYDVTDWAPSALGPMMANIGTTDCGTFPGLHSYYRNKDGTTPGLGARAVGDPDYHGEAYTASGVGIAHVLTWSPNAVTISVLGATPGDWLVLNQNWDPGWRAYGGDGVIDLHSAVATRLSKADSEITFRYIPRFFFLGCFIFFTTVAGLVWWARRKRRA